MKTARWLFILFATITACSVSAAPAPCENPNPLRFALIPRTDLARQLELHRPLLRHLERLLARPVSVIQPSSYGTVIEGLLAGTIDLASVGPAAYAIARNRDATIQPFVTWTMQAGTFVEAGAHSYNSLLITHQDSAIKGIADLKGRSVSLTDPASTSGSVLPREEFGKLVGSRLEQYFGRVSYSGSHDRSVEAVRKGYSDAAFVASEHLDEVIRQGRIDAREIKVLWKSQPIPHDPFVFRGNLCAELKIKLRDAFLADTPEIKAMLENLKGERFVPVTDEQYRELRETLSRGTR